MPMKRKTPSLAATLAESADLPLASLLERLRSAQLLVSGARDEPFPQPQALLDSFAATLDDHLRNEAVRPARDSPHARPGRTKNVISVVQLARYLVANLASGIELPRAPDGGGSGAVERLFLPYAPRIVESVTRATDDEDEHRSTDRGVLLAEALGGLAGLGMRTFEQRRLVASTCAGALESLLPRLREVPQDPILRAVSYVLSQAQLAALALNGDPADSSGLFREFPLSRKAGAHVGHLTYGIIVLELRVATVQLGQRYGARQTSPGSVAHPAWTVFTPLVYRGAVGDELVQRVLQDMALVSPAL